jgi:hypothetical protein
MVDMSKLKRKLVSGENTSGIVGVTSEHYWPHQLVSKTSCLNPPPSNSKMSHLHYFSGLTNIIVSSLPPDSCAVETENMLLFMAYTANMALRNDWPPVLDVIAAFFRGLEHGQLNWISWDKIEDFLVRAERQIRPRLAQNRNPDPHHSPRGRSYQLDHDTKKPKQEDVAGIPSEYFRSQKFCYLFNLASKCPEAGDHPIRGGRTILFHTCAGCFKRDSTRQSHPASSCKRGPFNDLF